MEYNQIAKRVIDFQKMSFDHWYNTLALFQDQAESTMDLVLNQATWIPENGRNAIQSWGSVCQQERGRFKSYLDKSFGALEKAFVENVKPAEKTKKAPTHSQS